MTTALVALGSNLGDREAQLRRAIEALRAAPDVQFGRSSSFHETQPVGGPGSQSAFLNAAATLDTSRSADQLLGLLHEVEAAEGRQRDLRWDARSLDLDLLLFGEAIQETPDLVLPHPRMAFRRFVLEPAAEIAPEMTHPLTGWTLAQHLEHLNFARNYIAITGSVGCGQDSLARIVCERSPDCRFLPAPWTTDEGSGGPPKEPGIEFVARCADALAPLSTECEAGWWISDFWFDQLLVAARLARFGDDASFEAHADTVTRPKLVVVLTDDPSNDLQQAIVDRAWQQGPVLKLKTGDQALAVAEVTAALEAMR